MKYRYANFENQLLTLLTSNIESLTRIFHYETSETENISTDLEVRKIHLCSKTALITSWIKINYYPLANKDARGYSNTTIHHSVLSAQNVSSELSRANIVHRIFTKLGTHILHIALILSLAYGGNQTLVHKAWSSLSLSIN